MNAVTLERTDGVAILILCDAEHCNLITLDMAARIEDAVATAAAADDVSVARTSRYQRGVITAAVPERPGLRVTAERSGAGWSLRGTLPAVAWAETADALFIASRLDPGLGATKTAPSTNGQSNSRR
jgi:hypothetical protein